MAVDPHLPQLCRSVCCYGNTRSTIWLGHKKMTTGSRYTAMRAFRETLCVCPTLIHSLGWILVSRAPGATAVSLISSRHRNLPRAGASILQRTMESGWRDEKYILLFVPIRKNTFLSHLTEMSKNAGQRVCFGPESMNLSLWISPDYFSEQHSGIPGYIGFFTFSSISA